MFVLNRIYKEPWPLSQHALVFSTICECRLLEIKMNFFITRRGEIVMIIKFKNIKYICTFQEHFEHAHAQDLVLI